MNALWEGNPVINRGAFKIADKFLTENELQYCIQLAEERYSSKERTHGTDSKYGHIDWFNFRLDTKNLAISKFKSKFHLQEDDITLSVIYYLNPNAFIHPHRDLTGASVNNRIRFHIPLITNPNVVFNVNNENVFMSPGELWVLDTSYKHSVFNGGGKTRAHIVIECETNSHIKKYLFNDFASRIHTVEFAIWAMTKFTQSIFINSIKNPKYFKSQMKMVWDFLINKTDSRTNAKKSQKY